MAYNSLKKLTRRFKSDTSGNVALIFAASMLPLLFSVGAAVDYSRYSDGFGRMVSAGDAAIFAASKKMNGSNEDDNDILQAELEEEFDKFMAANYNPAKYNIEFTRALTYNREENTMSVELAGVQDTAFLKVVQISSLPFTSTLGTRLETTPENYVIDIVMCIDATGSMQNTLNSVQANAATFNAQLRSELSIAENDPRFKIRIRPIYYRDWADARPSTRYGWGTITGYGWYRHGYHWHYGDYSYYGWGLITTPGSVEKGIKLAPDFYDLDVAAESTSFQAFLNSETASGGGDAPEAAGACLNEGMRSDWYDREETADFPVNENVTVFPIIVTWTDNSIQSLSLTQQYLSPTQPTTYANLEAQWENSSIIPQDPKLLILFGPQTWSGWSTIRNWENYEYGGSISTGNSQAISVIAEKIVESIPDVLRLTN